MRIVLAWIAIFTFVLYLVFLMFVMNGKVTDFFRMGIGWADFNLILINILVLGIDLFLDFKIINNLVGAVATFMINF